MPTSTGIHAEHGSVLTDWDHVVQSIGQILTTPIGSRVLRRDFGSEVPALIDRPMTERVILGVYAATQMALYPRRVGGSWYGEPRFRLTRCEIVQAGADGCLSLEISGQYMPRGHLGDFTVADDAASATIALGRAA